jgi:hypothetical protein
LDAVQILRAEHVDYAIIGALAAAVHGVIRAWTATSIPAWKWTNACSTDMPKDLQMATGAIMNGDAF